MKPAWDQLGSEYEASSSVVVADVDCTIEQDLCSAQGVNGYPTIKYWNFGESKDAQDYSGGRDFSSLKTFVEETLEVKCDVKDQERCTQKEKDYITKMQAKSADDIKKQTDRLSNMVGGKMTAEAKQWVAQRLNILKQL
eukprot:TRINITY_DN68099_c2_g6_i1.p2 TRINITY_DN68099_c2_g6~~TRINITY_DN68099_c2_g6_i1.p2  ORF type:complete len:139 (-),score=27.86 TRINITY_DN68099_c2_g6_i1:267-683(-)